MANGNGVVVRTYEDMPRPQTRGTFSSWLVPARNNIQREMLRFRPVVAAFPFAGIPKWILEGRPLMLGVCFSLWRSVFQAKKYWEDKPQPTSGLDFLDKIIEDNSATYQTELNRWSLSYYIENAVYRLRECRDLAITGGVDKNILPTASVIGKSENESTDFLADPFTPYGEWEECFLAAHAIISEMIGGLKKS